MSSVECANETGYPCLESELGELPGTSSDPGAKLRSRVFVGFGSSMALGLLLAGWYVGQRILVVEQTAPASTAIAAVQQAPAVVLPPAQPIKASAPPRVPQTFLEVAGLSAKQDARFVRKLEARGLSALIDVDPQANTRRILIGPFTNREAVEAAQDKLDTLGILALERTY